MTNAEMISLIDKWKTEARERQQNYIHITEKEADQLIGLLAFHSSPCIHEWYHGSCVHCNMDAPKGGPR